MNVAEQSVMIGDLNQDELINVLDIVQIVNIILGQEPSAYQQEAGDLNLDGSLNVLDIVSLVDSILNGIDIGSGDINGDNVVNIIDVVMLVDMILTGG